MRKIKISFLCVVIASVSLFSCKKKSGIEKSSKKFDLVVDKVTFKVAPTSSLGVQKNIFFFKHRMNLDSLVKTVNVNYSKANLRSFTLRSCKIAIVDETVANSLGNFSSVSLDVVALDSKLFSVASTTSIKDTAIFTVTMPSTSVRELPSFFSNDTISYQLSGDVRKVLTNELRGDLQLIYDVTVSD